MYHYCPAIRNTVWIHFNGDAGVWKGGGSFLHLNLARDRNKGNGEEGKEKRRTRCAIYMCVCVCVWKGMTRKLKDREQNSWGGGERPRLSTLRHMAVSFLITLQLAGRLPALCVCECECVSVCVCVCPSAYAWVSVSKSSHWTRLKIIQYHLTSLCVWET